MMTKNIELKRAYDKAGNVDGKRVLVDRLWPRGVSKEDAKLYLWLKEIAPTDGLRKSFHDDEIDFDSFNKKYRKELSSGEQEEAYKKLKKIVSESDHKVTLVFSAKDETHNNAVVLQDMLRK